MIKYPETSWSHTHISWASAPLQHCLPCPPPLLCPPQLPRARGTEAQAGGACPQALIQDIHAVATWQHGQSQQCLERVAELRAVAVDDGVQS